MARSELAKALQGLQQQQQLQSSEQYHWRNRGIGGGASAPPPALPDKLRGIPPGGSVLIDELEFQRGDMQRAVHLDPDLQIEYSAYMQRYEVRRRPDRKPQASAAVRAAAEWTTKTARNAVEELQAAVNSWLKPTMKKLGI